MSKKSRVQRIKIVIENIDDRWFWQIDGGPINGGFARREAVYVAISDYMIAIARLHNDDARAARL